MAQWESVLAERDTLGEPTIPNYEPPFYLDPWDVPAHERAFYVSELGEALSATVLAKILLEEVIDELHDSINDPNSSANDRMPWAKEVLKRYDQYLFNYRLTVRLLAIVPDGLDAQQEQQYNSLGISFAGVPLVMTLDQYEGLRKDFTAVGRSLSELDENLSVLKGATQGVAVLGGMAAVVLYLPAAAGFALTSGIAMTYGGYALGLRTQEIPNVWTALGAAAVDTVGITSLAITIRGKAPFTGRIVGPEEYGEHLIGGGAFLTGVTAFVTAVIRSPAGALKTVIKEIFLGDQKNWPKAGTQGTEVVLPGQPANAPLEAVTEVQPHLRIKTEKVRIDEANVEIVVHAVAPRPPKVAPYSELTGELNGTGLQANHLNQNAAYRDIIPEASGLAIGMRGNAFTEPGTQHYRFHEVLETFWNRYRKNGPEYNNTPTNALYGQALQNALEAAGLAPADAADIAALAK